jgi:hypothetical protein
MLSIINGYDLNNFFRGGSVLIMPDKSELVYRITY